MLVKHDNKQQKWQFRSVTEKDLHSFRVSRVRLTLTTIVLFL